MSGFEKTLITKDRTLNNGNTIFYYLSFILKTPPYSNDNNSTNQFKYISLFIETMYKIRIIRDKVTYASSL